MNEDIKLVDGVINYNGADKTKQAWKRIKSLLTSDIKLKCPECGSNRIDSRQTLTEIIDYENGKISRSSDFPPQFSCDDCGHCWEESGEK